MEHQRIEIAELSVDRAYINSDLVQKVRDDGGEVLCKPWAGRNSRADLFHKSDFKYPFTGVSVY
jgi:hypothetical protein